MIMELRRSVSIGGPVPVLPSWLTDPLWDQFAALLPERPAVDPSHPLPSPSSRPLELLEDGRPFQALMTDTLGYAKYATHLYGNFRAAATGMSPTATPSR